MEQELTAEQEALLLERKMLGTSTSPGKRRVSLGLLSPPVSDRSRSVSTASSESSGSIRLVSQPSPSDLFFDMPTRSESVEGLQFVGFEEHTAKTIYHSWANRPDPLTNPDDFLDYVRGHLSQQNSTAFKQLYLDAHNTMVKLGFELEFITPILDPRFQCVFETQRLSYWVEDTVQIRYRTLQHLLARLRAIGEEAVEIRSKQASMDTGNPSGTANRQTMSQPSSSVTMTQESELDYLSNCTILDSDPPVLPNHTTLYKGKAADGLQDPIMNPLIRNTGSIDFHALRTLAGGDFNATTSALYWTDDKACAEKYRLYAANRCPHSETWIVSIQVPNSFLQGLNIQTLTYSNPWKEYVWLCRTQVAQLPMPTKFNNLAVDADIIKGHILFRLSSFLATMDYGSVRARTTEQDVMSLNDIRCTQWTFMKRSAIDSLAEVVRGKVHTDRYPCISLPA